MAIGRRRAAYPHWGDRGAGHSGPAGMILSQWHGASTGPAEMGNFSGVELPSHVTAYGGYYMGDSRMTQHNIPTNPYTYYYRCYNCGWGDAMGGSHGGRGGHSQNSGRMSSKTYGDFMEPISWGQAGIAGKDRYGNTHRNSRKLFHGHLQWLVKVY